MPAPLPRSQPAPAQARGAPRRRLGLDWRVAGARCVAIAGVLLCGGVVRAEPVEPAGPVEPVEPAGPVEPVEPAGPVEPVAPSAPAGGAGAEAEARYRQGIAEFEAGHWREAVELFKQADALAPSQWLSFNIAKIFERMRDSRSALAWYRDYVRRCRDAVPLPDVLARIGELEAELASQGVQQLSVLSSPPGATVLLDGASRGVTPYTGELPPGVHVLELRLRGHHDTWRELTLPAEHAIDVVVALAPIEGTAAAPLAVAPAAGVTLAAAPARAHEPPDRAAPEPATVSVWTWTLFGGSAALLLGSAAVELSRRGLEDRARETPTQIDYARRYAAVESRRDTARVLLGAGALLGVAGGVGLYLDLRDPGPDADGLALGCAPELCGVLARQSW